MPKRQWLVRARLRKGLTQDDIAKAVNISRSTYGEYERGMRNPLGQTAYELSKLLDFKMERFYEEQEG